MTREEAIERLKQNKAAAEFYAGMVQNTNAIENELKDIEAMNMGIEALQADRPTEWIPFKKRPLTDEEKEEYPDWIYIFDCPLPDDGQEILLSNGKYVWTDTFIDDGECYLDGGDDIDEGMAWMPMPEPYKGGGDE